MIARLADVAGIPVSRETLHLLERYAHMLRAESARQNLVAASTIQSLWERHILDSAQFVRFESAPGATWVDIGSGAGLPGLVIAMLVAGPVRLVEPRRLRAQFLEKAVHALGLADRVTVAPQKAERVAGSFDMVVARAVAPADKVLRISLHLSTKKTIWVLPKGQRAQSELADARRNWHCDSDIVPSCTDPESRILVIRNVRARGGR